MRGILAAFRQKLHLSRCPILPSHLSWRNDVFVERLWRSVKYEEVYLGAYDSVGHARTSLGRYLDFYDSKRSHSSLDARTPD